MSRWRCPSVGHAQHQWSGRGLPPPARSLSIHRRKRNRERRSLRRRQTRREIGGARASGHLGPHALRRACPRSFANLSRLAPRDGLSCVDADTAACVTKSIRRSVVLVDAGTTEGIVLFWVTLLTLT